jgi:hypothetical protein
MVRESTAEETGGSFAKTAKGLPNKSLEPIANAPAQLFVMCLKKEG